MKKCEPFDSHFNNYFDNLFTIPQVIKRYPGPASILIEKLNAALEFNVKNRIKELMVATPPSKGSFHEASNPVSTPIGKNKSAISSFGLSFT